MKTLDHALIERHQKTFVQMFEITESATEALPVVEPYINSKYDPNRVWLNQGSESEWTPDETAPPPLPARDGAAP